MLENKYVKLGATLMNMGPYPAPKIDKETTARINYGGAKISKRLMQNNLCFRETEVVPRYRNK